MLWLFELIVLIFSIVIHEVSHGFMAERLGDSTARQLGRLTLNPLKHVDLFGSIILPLGLYFLSSGAITFGWAKPVPYNPYLLRNPKSDAGKIAAMGPISNLSLAVIFGLAIRLLSSQTFVPSSVIYLFSTIVIVNISLAMFNLIPIPPLDGSKILYAVLPNNHFSSNLINFLDRYGFFVLIILVMTGVPFLSPAITHLFSWFTGLI